MKKLFSLFVAAMTLATMTITSCEDVPAPYEVNLSGSGSSSSTDDATATGSGTLADPYSVTKVCALVSAGTLSSTTYAYVSGRVSQFDSISLQYGNAYYYISIDGSLTGKQLQVYRGYYTGGNKFTSNDQALQVGDSVVIYGTYQLYSSKYEINSGSKIAYLNGTSYDVAEVTTDVTGTPSGNGTLESPYNTAAALKLIYAGNAPSDKVYVQGRVCASDLSVDTSSYGNATYYISADGSSTDRLEVYRGYGLGGNKFTSADELQAGDSVIVYGTLVYYNNKTPEFTTGSSIVYRNGETASTGGDSTGGEGGEILTGTNLLSNGDFEQWSESLPVGWKSTTTASSATLSQSTDVHGGSYAVSVEHSSSGNKRLASSEISLKAGTYQIAFWVKSADASATTSVRPGYVPVTDGVVGSYAYGDYTNDVTTEWTQVSYSFTLSAATTVNLVVMLPKSAGASAIIDDFSLITSDGGLAETESGTDDPVEETGTTYDFTSAQGDWSIENKVAVPDGLTAVWTQSSKYGMVASAYVNNAAAASESWLISPEVTLAEGSMTFNEAANKFTNADNLAQFATIKVSDDAGATWNDVTFTHAATGSAWTFVDATVDLSAYAGKAIRIAFVYTSDIAVAGSWEIKTVTLK
ncbi:MAG: choice-of-anchor J domain-containing protein [Bacteroidales bacterium]|nr:choice-of-anchor J domain-containing protein [Bacteroidales bacterium]